MLKDEKDDALFFYPLTVKVRLPDAWKSIRAIQNAKGIESKIAEHEGAKYALVNAVPNKGSVVLTAE